MFEEMQGNEYTRYIKIFNGILKGKLLPFVLMTISVGSSFKDDIVVNNR